MRYFVFLFSLLLWASVAKAQVPNTLFSTEKGGSSSKALLFPSLDEPKQLSASYYWYGSAAMMSVVSGVTGVLYLSTVAELRELSVVSANKMPNEILYAQSADLKNKSKKLALASGLSLSFAVGSLLGGAFWTKHEAKLILAPSLYKSTIKLKITF
jgi:hypothetical protein